jgi:hypothetical protein
LLNLLDHLQSRQPLEFMLGEEVLMNETFLLGTHVKGLEVVEGWGRDVTLSQMEKPPLVGIQITPHPVTTSGYKSPTC